MNSKITDYKLRVAAHNLDVHLVDCLSKSDDASIAAWADDILTMDEIEEAIVMALERRGFKIEWPEHAGHFSMPLKES